MLVLSRNISEKIQIGNDIVLEVVDIRGDRVRFGITAPKNVPIMRTELLPKQNSNTLPRVHENGDEPLW
ncbi:MAG: carbon storage regulator [Planctomycetaceae bacterium]|jgi:carbon storage regulator|nr:carbon storage regulator [Planctomycetaceae bacterium]